MMKRLLLFVPLFLAGCSSPDPATVDVSSVTPQALSQPAVDANAVFDEAVSPKTLPQGERGNVELIERSAMWLGKQNDPAKVRAFKNQISAAAQISKSIVGDTASIRSDEWLDKACDEKLAMLENRGDGGTQQRYDEAITQARANAKIGALTPSPFATVAPPA